MEGDKIYEISREELYKIIKQSTDEIKIDISKLDTVTKGEMLAAIKNVANKRIKDIEKVIFGVK